MAALTGHSVQRSVCAVCGPITTQRCLVGERLRAKAYRDRMTPEQAVQYRRSNALKHKFGLTIEQYDELFARQRGVCAICRQPPSYRGLDVDHDHDCCPGRRSCGKCVRGLLCSPCNRAVGYFRDDPDLMRAAVRYLEDTMTVDPAEHPDHPHGSTVEQVHRILGQAYADEPDRWMLAEELVKFVTTQIAREGIAADRIDAATRLGRPVSIADHLEEAERLLGLAFLDNRPERAPGGYYGTAEFHTTQITAAEVHARIAHAAAAAGLLRPDAPPEGTDTPGLDALVKLADAVDRLATLTEAQS